MVRLAVLTVAAVGAAWGGAPFLSADDNKKAPADPTAELLSKLRQPLALPGKGAMPPGEQEDVVRDAAKRLIRLTPFLLIDALDEPGMHAVVQAAFADATNALGTTTRIPAPSSTARPRLFVCTSPIVHWLRVANHL